MADAATSGGGSAGGLIGTLFIRLTAQDDMSKKTEDVEKKVVKSVEKMDKAVDMLKHSLEILGVAFGIHEVVEFVKGVIEGADELKKFSEELDIGIDKLAGFKFAADKANVGDQFQMGMRKFAESMREAQVEGSNMQALFKDLQIDPTKGMDQAFEKVVDKFGKWENGINKMGMAQELFGTRNARFVNILSTGTEGLKKDTEELAKVLGVSYEEAALKAAEYTDSVTTLKAAFTGLALTFINEALPALIDFNKQFAENLPQYKEIAKEIGTGFVIAIKAALVAVNSLKAGFQVIGISILGIMEGIMKFSRMLAQSLAVAIEFWINGAISAINFGARSINTVIDKLPDWVKDRLPGGAGGKIPEIEFFKMKDPSGLDDWINIVTDARKDMVSKFQDTQETIRENLSGIGHEFTKGFDDTAKVVKEGNKKLEAALKEGGLSAAPNSQAFKQAFAAHNEGLKKFTGFDSGLNKFTDDPRGNMKTDIGNITGIQGDAKGSFAGQEQLKQIETNLKEIQKLRDDHFDLTKEQEQRLTDMEKLYAEKRSAIKMAEAHLQLQTASSMFGDLADISKAWAGEQSGIYKTMFAISKAFAIADATVKIAQGIAAAAANPWPLNLFAMASVVAATASIVSSIQSVQLAFGGERALGGPVSPDKAFLVGERGPEMFVPRSGGSIVPNNRLGGGPAKIIVNNYTDAKPEVREREEGGEKVIELVVKRVKNELGSDVRDGKGSFNKALTDSFNLRRSAQ